ncbi:hypothetical protein EYS14_10230 [Alteromonadaceae bacterium M269]|nr:hypothetical protein EYS14_10230 [Alteromonadaceae bacterium M269]
MLPFKNSYIPLAALTLATQLLLVPSVDAQAIKVEIVENNGKYQLLRGGKPYHIKGAGVDHLDLQSLADHGGNSFRTWAVDDGAEPAQQLLDRAHALGLTVSLCLEFARERHGFDYNDPVAVAKQFEETKARVEKYKDHPALLTWFIGNELNFDFKNPKVYDAVDDVAKMIHEIDPNHPVTTTIAGFDKKALKAIKKRALNLDFISFQLYADLVNLPKYLDKMDFDEPYFVTEWGSVGHWEVGKTKWGAPVENTSSEKASNYAKSYLKVLQPFIDQAIGNYVFLWGQKQEKTPTWYGMYLDSGEETEAIDIMHYIWNGKWPENRTPRVSPIQLNKRMAYDNIYLFSGKTYQAQITVEEPDNDPITYKWEVRKESTATEVGGDHEAVPPVIEGLIEDTTAAKINLTAPKEKGAYRLFVYIYDGNNNAAHANVPFFVK